MRTTLTIDDDVFDELKSEAGRRKRPFKEVVNETLRRGLSAGGVPAEPYVLPAVDLGYPPRMGVEAGLRLADALEDEEIQRKLSMKK